MTVIAARRGRRLLTALATGALVAVLDAPAGGAEIGELSLRQTRIDLRLRLDYEEGSLAGSARIGFVNDGERAVSEVPLNLNRLMGVQAARGPDGERPYRQEVARLVDFDRLQVDHVEIELARPLLPGAASWIEVDYSGYLVGYTETGSRYIRDRIDEEFTILRTDALAFPELGTLSFRRNREAPSGDFDYRVELDVPANQVVASAGRLIERRAGQERVLWVYESVAPVPFLNLPIAPYVSVEEGGLRVFCFPHDRVGAQALLGRGRKALAQLGAWFGPPAGGTEVTLMEIPEGWGSQASLTGGILQTADVFRPDGDLAPLYHELSHLWNASDLERPSPRWNEGLATYLQALLAEKLDGWSGRQTYLERAADRLLERIDASSKRDVPFAAYGEQGLTDWSYLTGMLFFDMLERTMGPERLLRALGEHYQAHKASGTTFADLERALARASDLDLAPLFRDWVHTTRWQGLVRTRESLAVLAATYRPPA